MHLGDSTSMRKIFVQLERKKICRNSNTGLPTEHIVREREKKLILMPILQLLPVSWQHRAEPNVLAIQLLTSLHLSLSTVAQWNALGGQMRIHLR